MPTARGLTAKISGTIVQAAKEDFMIQSQFCSYVLGLRNSLKCQISRLYSVSIRLGLVATYLIPMTSFAYAADIGAEKSEVLKSYIAQVAAMSGAVDGTVSKCIELGTVFDRGDVSLSFIELQDMVQTFPRADNASYFEVYQAATDASASVAENMYEHAKSRVFQQYGYDDDPLTQSLADGKGRESCFEMLTAAKRKLEEARQRYIDSELAYNLSKKK